MKAFVTGASGFVGAGLARALLARGDEVHCLVRASSNLWRLDGIKKELHFHTGDFLDKEVVSRSLLSAQPSVVFHLGSYGTYPKQQNDTAKILEATLLGAHTVFSAAKENGVGMVVNAGSSSEYGPKDHPMREDEPLAPSSYYAVGKAAQTFLGQHMARAEGFPIVTLRLFSIYGPFEEPGRFVPTVISNALRGIDVPIADPHIARDFLYLPDAIDAFLLAAEKPELSGEVINVGSGTQSTLLDVYNAVIAKTGSASKASFGKYEKRPFDTNIWVADTDKMHTLLECTPRFTLAEGIADMVKWFPSHAHVYETTSKSS